MDIYSSTSICNLKLSDITRCGLHEQEHMHDLGECFVNIGYQVYLRFDTCLDMERFGAELVTQAQRLANELAQPTPEYSAQKEEV